MGAITQCRRGGADVLGRCDQSTILRVQKGKKKVVLVFSKYLFWRCFYANLKFGTLTFVELLKKSDKRLVLQHADCFGCSSLSSVFGLVAQGCSVSAGLNWWERHWYILGLCVSEIGPAAVLPLVPLNIPEWLKTPPNSQCAHLD